MNKPNPVAADPTKPVTCEQTFLHPDIVKSQAEAVAARVNPNVRFGLRVKPRLYICRACGHEQKISTNHTGQCYDRCGGCSWKGMMPNVSLDAGRYHAGLFRPFAYIGANPTKAGDWNPHSGVKWNDIEE